jgi:hypothetical protein
MHRENDGGCRFAGSRLFEESPFGSATNMAEDGSITNAAAPRRGPILIVAGALGLVLAGTVALWSQYGTAVFFETIRAGLAACFG